jgi:ubiquinone biosynthesis protein
MPTKLEDAARVTQIARVCAKHGLGSLAVKAGLAWTLPFFQRMLTPENLPANAPRALRESFEELGAVFIKLGQMLSLRPDLIPHEYSDEFRKLLDEVPPEPFESVRKAIESEFKKPLRMLFKEFDPKPIGSASVAQVHRARLPDGTRVVVKVQRPGIRKQFAVDIELLKFLAHKMDQRLAGSEYSFTEVVREFERYTRNELNFLFEARNADRFRKNFHKHKAVVVPQVFWDRTTERVLTMEELHGTKLSDIAKAQARIDRKAVIKHLVDVGIIQFFETDLFHADLHPGNILVLPGSRIGLLDFGIVGVLDDTLRAAGIDLFTGIIRRDTEQVTRVLLKVGAATADTDFEQFRQDVRAVMNTWVDMDDVKARATHVLHVLLNTAVKHHIRMSPEIVLLAKALMTVEGSCEFLDKDFDFVEASLPRITAMLRAQRRPVALAKRAARRGREIGETLAELPGEALEVFERLKSGKLSMDVEDVRHLGADINLSFNRLSYALLAAAFIIGGAMLVDIGPKIGALSIFTIGGTAVGLFLAVLLLHSLVVWERRAGHKD